MCNMLIPILAIVIALVAWSLHLMQEAIDRREFSLMLAGTLVAFSAAALMAVYCLIGNYVGYVTNATHYVPSDPLTATSVDWLVEYDPAAEPLFQPDDSSSTARQMATVLASLEQSFDRRQYRLPAVFFVCNFGCAGSKFCPCCMGLTRVPSCSEIGKFNPLGGRSFQNRARLIEHTSV